MAKKENVAPLPAVPRETLVVTEGVTTIINPMPAKPETKEKEDAQDPRGTAGEG
jgi:hypothetical protein